MIFDVIMYYFGRGNMEKHGTTMSLYDLKQNKTKKQNDLKLKSIVVKGDAYNKARIENDSVKMYPTVNRKKKKREKQFMILSNNGKRKIKRWKSIDNFLIGWKNIEKYATKIDKKNENG